MWCMLLMSVVTHHRMPAVLMRLTVMTVQIYNKHTTTGQKSSPTSTAVFTSICVSVCFLDSILKIDAAQITKLDMQMFLYESPGNPFILGSVGQRSRSRVTKTVPAWVVALL